jgi:Tol biopolymer transport system component/tRNA A-37 threonylcarbamoyl transferase component Bud32
MTRTMSLVPGVRLGPYEIVTLIGAGAMGEVYRARDTRLNRTVAVKVLHASLDLRPESKARFQREAEVVAALNDPHICAIYDIGEANGLTYLVIEHVDGESLAARMLRAPLRFDEVLSIGIAIACAVSKAHQSGVIHRDLKPANIMLSKAGVKLLDFGVARLRSPAGDAEPADAATGWVTQERAIVGTPRYMAPEQVRGEPADTPADIFAIGLILQEMATAGTVSPAARQTTPAQRLAALRTVAPAAFVRLVASCLEEEPDVRWRDAGDLAIELKWLAEQPPAAAPVAGVSGTGLRGYRSVAVSTLLFAAAVAIGLYWRGSINGAVGEKRLTTFEVLAPVGRGIGSVRGEPPPAISPDGQRLAFVVRPPTGATQIAVRSIDNGKTIAVVETNGATVPFWSADGSTLGYFRDGKLRVTDLNSGHSRVLCDVAGRPLGASWSRTGVIVFATTGQGIFKISDSGGQPTAVTELQTAAGEIRHAGPAFLPDGKRFLYVVRRRIRVPPFEELKARVGSIDAPETTEIGAVDAYPQYSAAGYLLWVRADAAHRIASDSPWRPVFEHRGTLMARAFNLQKLTFSGEPLSVAEGVQLATDFDAGAFSVSNTGTLVYRTSDPFPKTRLVWFNRVGTRLADFNAVTLYPHAVISPDDSRVAFNEIDAKTGMPEIWVIELSSGVRRRLTFDASADVIPVWSPDSQEIAFTSDRRGLPALFAKRADGAGAERLIYESPETKLANSWSRDGSIFFHQFGSGGYDVWRLRPSGEVKQVTQTRAAAGGMLSPDGKWLLYSDGSTGTSTVMVQGLPPNEGQWQIASGRQATWRSDGKEIFFLSSDYRRLLAVDVTTSGNTFNAGKERELFTIRTWTGPPTPVFSYAVTASGDRFLVDTIVEDGKPGSMSVVLNWPVVLDR